MNVYEQVKNMTMDEFRDFCFWLYNEGWFDHSNGIDGESWFYACYPEQEEVYPDMENM